MARYRFVLFDVGGTLVGPRRSYGAVYHRVLRDLGVDVDERRFEGCIRATSAEMSRRIPPGHDRFGHFDGGETEYWRRFIDEVLRCATGRAPEPEFVQRSLARLWKAFGRTDVWRVYDDAVPALEGLRRGGTRLGVVSNWDSRLPALLKLLGLADYFEAVGVSHVEGVEKPDAALFRCVLQRLGAEPDEALHVGDLEELDVAGARAAGIDAVRIARDDPRGEPTTIHDLRELVPIVAAGLEERLSPDGPR